MGLYDNEDEDEQSPAPAPQGNEAEMQNRFNAPAAEPQQDVEGGIEMARQIGQQDEPTDEEKQAKIKDYLTKKYGDTLGGDMAEVRAAQEKRNWKDQVAGFTGGLQQMFGGPGADLRQSEGMRKDAATEESDALNNLKMDQAATQQVLQQKMQAQENQPGSEMSQNFAKFLQGPLNLNDDQVAQLGGMSMAQQKVQLPAFVKAYEAKLARDAQTQSAKEIADQKRQAEKDIADQRAEERKDAERTRRMLIDQANKDRQFRMDQAQQQRDDNQIATRGKDLDASVATSRSGVGLAFNKVQNAKRVMAAVPGGGVTQKDIVEAEADPAKRQALVQRLNQVSPQYYNEVVSGLLNTIAPGQGSLGAFDHLRADSADVQLANIKQYFSENPAPANMGEFLMSNMDSLNREINVSQDVIDDHLKKVDAKYPGLRKRRGADVDAQDNAMGLVKSVPSTPGTPPPAAAAPTTETKMIGNDTYQKVPGGWKKVGGK